MYRPRLGPPLLSGTVESYLPPPSHPSCFSAAPGLDHYDWLLYRASHPTSHSATLFHPMTRPLPSPPQQTHKPKFWESLDKSLVAYSFSDPRARMDPKTVAIFLRKHLVELQGATASSRKLADVNRSVVDALALVSPERLGQPDFADEHGDALLRVRCGRVNQNQTVVAEPILGERDPGCAQCGAEKRILMWAGSIWARGRVSARDPPAVPRHHMAPC